ncbi:MAG: hypothetical protein K9L24_00800 [Spirochaetia bacterium]|nr:hypothetical protein [Spirochaetia bacterium]MCF7945379.1 hypothetical protein [Spirochaetia bacterium]
MKLITNSNKPKDRMFLCIEQESVNTDIWIASAFFSDIYSLTKMVNNNSTVKLLIRLNIGTSVTALEEALRLPNLEIRYYSVTLFHPKYYIFGDRVAYIGSSNFTRSGMTTNQEMNIEINSDNPIFEDLRSNFIEFWGNAAVLTKEKVKIFKDILRKYPPSQPHDKVSKAVGDVFYDTLGKDEKKDRVSSFYHSFSRRYQTYITHFNSLKEKYKETNFFKFPELPLRIEVDRFLWWVREFKATGDTYKKDKSYSKPEIENLVKPLFSEFQKAEIPYLENDNVPNYLEIANAFSSEENIDNLTIDSLFDILMHIHAFHDCLRFYQGGENGLKQFFLDNNEHEKIRNTIKYLVFGQGEYQRRVCDCIFDEDYKLNGFGESCVKELYGLVNKQDIPVSNGRTIKSMEFLGFGKL